MIYELNIITSRREEMIDLTNDVKTFVSKSKIKEGACIVYVPHSTAAIIINENYDLKICADIIQHLANQVPQGVWKHDQVDGNADAHIKASIIGPSETIIIKENKLMLGTWQGIALLELDGPRQRKIIVSIMGE